MTNSVVCPNCGQGEAVNKVSAIYIHALEAKHSAAARSAATPMVPLRGIDTETLPALGKRLAPPAAPRQMPTRPVHPDLVVLVFSLVLPVFLAGIRASQPAMLLPMLVVLGLGYGLYFWKRAAAIAKFERQRHAYEASGARVRRGLERWMQLYYCAADDVVFEAGRPTAASADLIAGYLFREE